MAAHSSSRGLGSHRCLGSGQQGRFVAVRLLKCGDGLRHGQFSGNRGILDVYGVAVGPVEIFPHVLADPFPLPTRVDGERMAAIDRTSLEQHVAVDSGVDLHMSLHAMPEHAAGDPLLGRSQQSATSIDSAEWTWVALAGGAAGGPDGIAAGITCGG